MPLTLDDVRAALVAEGLAFRGAFHPGPDDAAPDTPEGPAGTVVLAGNAGPGMWAAFSKSEWAAEHPLDAWSRRVMGAIAERLGGRYVNPSDGPPYPPFLRWAQNAEPVRPSAIGMLIHPDYGLWHAYRGALVLAERLALPPPDTRPRPCDSCADKPCLTACPVGAFAPDGYDVAACASHVASAAGSDCRTAGCLARHACPVGRDYAYAPEQAAFHMAAFLRAQGETG